MIQLKALTFGYEKKPILDDVSCELQDGRITALIGPNGAGKSTLLRLIARLEKPWSGEIAVGNLPQQSYDTRSFARTLAFLPQSRPLPLIPVRTLVMHGRFARLGPSRRPSAEDEHAVDIALETTGLKDLQHRDVSTLSGGQRQKAYLAMAIAQEAQHILLDEPLTHLDVGAQLELVDILHRLRSEGRCIAMVVHDLALLPKVCDHVLLMHEGRILCSADPANLFDSGMIERAFGVRPVYESGFSFQKISL